MGRSCPYSVSITHKPRAGGVISFITLLHLWRYFVYRGISLSVFNQPKGHVYFQYLISPHRLPLLCQYPRTKDKDQPGHSGKGVGEKVNSDLRLWFLVPKSYDFRILFCFVLLLFYFTQPVRRMWYQTERISISFRFGLKETCNLKKKTQWIPLVLTRLLMIRN